MVARGFIFNMTTYHANPKPLGQFFVEGTEQLRYQYLPIKLVGETEIKLEKRLFEFNSIIGAACCDYVGSVGLNAFVNSYVYITAKRLFQKEDKPITRPGWHTDGFMTDDINYIWSDELPTIFNRGIFNLSDDDQLSLIEMEQQANPGYDWSWRENTLLRLTPFVVHKADETPFHGIRTFVKISISKDKYDLLGNSHNYLLDYDWVMRPRQDYRNIPQFLG